MMECICESDDRLHQFNQLMQEKLENLQISFMNNGNVTIVTMVVENSQIPRAVDLQRRVNCEMQLNGVLNVHIHVAVHSCTFQRNKMCITPSEHPVCVLYTVDTHTVQSRFTFPTHTHFTLNLTL
jgi:hypothetical protein